MSTTPPATPATPTPQPMVLAMFSGLVFWIARHRRRCRGDRGTPTGSTVLRDQKTSGHCRDNDPSQSRAEHPVAGITERVVFAGLGVARGRSGGSWRRRPGLRRGKQRDRLGLALGHVELDALLGAAVAPAACAGRGQGQRPRAGPRAQRACHRARPAHPRRRAVHRDLEISERLERGGAILGQHEPLVAGRQQGDATPPVAGRGHELADVLLALRQVEQRARAFEDRQAGLKLRACGRVVALSEGAAALLEERLGAGVARLRSGRAAERQRNRQRSEANPGSEALQGSPLLERVARGRRWGRRGANGRRAWSHAAPSGRAPDEPPAACSPRRASGRSYRRPAPGRRSPPRPRARSARSNGWAAQAWSSGPKAAG